MSGSMVMYPLKPIICSPCSTKHKSVMYEMKNIHETHHENGDHSPSEDTIVSQITDQKPSPELKILEARQEKILSQLAELKQQVESYRHVLKQSNQMVCEPVVQTPVTIDIVLNVNPEKPPVSIFALIKTWKDTSFQIESHFHSSLKESIPGMSMPKIEQNNQKNRVNLRLIWKNVPDLELKCNLTACPLEGEVNFLRYLSRAVTSHCYEKSISEANLMDSMLDFCHVLSQQSTKEVETSILRLNDHLTQGPWLLNKKEPSIVDMAAWSVIKRHKLKLTAKLDKWFKNCEKTFIGL